MNKSALFTPLKIGSMNVMNRSFMAPMSLGYESDDGSISPKLQAYWLKRAKGGVGCIITDALSVDPRMPYLGNTLYLSENNLGSYQSFIEKVHQSGTKIIPQITHPGPESVIAFHGIAPLASSCYINSMGQKTRAVTLEEIPGIISMYANTSYLAKQAGFDGIELHCAHAYMLLGSFLSPMRNKRCDEYGGSLDHRARLLFEVIDAIKEKCGKDFPIVLRMSGSEKNPQGNTVEDMLYLIPQLIQHGIDAFEVSGGTQYEQPNKIIPCDGEVEGLNVPQAKAIKACSSVPVIVVGKIMDPKYAQYLLDSKQVDGIVFGRALLADSDYIKKCERQEYDDIAPCASCGVGCVGEQTKRRPASCVINPALGREEELELKATDHKKKVVVVGGGIGGMACANTLAKRGHEVILLEKSVSLGGQLKVACVPPYKQDISKWVIYLSKQLVKHQVKIELGVEANQEIIDQYHPDTIVIATGAKEIIPPIEGVDASKAILAQQVLNKDVSILGGNILIVGGGIVGCEVCETLVHQKLGELHITMIDMLDKIAGDMVPSNYGVMMKRLSAANINLMPSTKLCKVEENRAYIESRGQAITLSNLTHIIYACGSKSENALYEALKDSTKEIYLIGDAHAPAQALEAVRDGVEIGIKI
ncbi:MAG: FAD-dependent oxidoreductase [Erysipelotrichaceae bacterium]